MGTLLGKLIPDLGFFKNATINSNCCNKNQETSFSYVRCINCGGSGKIFIKSLDHNNIDVKRNIKEISAITNEKS